MVEAKKTVVVKRANVVLTINADDVERYIKKGFDVLDANGVVVKSATPNDINTLQKAYVEHLAEIKALKEEIAQLKASKKSVATTTSEDVGEKPAKKPTRRKKTTD